MIGFEQSRKYNGVRLWNSIQRRVKPTTTVGASNYKADIEKATNVVKFNTWFDNTGTIIIKEEGDGYDNTAGEDLLYTTSFKTPTNLYDKI